MHASVEACCFFDKSVEACCYLNEFPNHFDLPIISFSGSHKLIDLNVYIIEQFIVFESPMPSDVTSTHKSKFSHPII